MNRLAASAAVTLIAATGVAHAADVVVGVWDGDQFVEAGQTEDDKIVVVPMSMSDMADFIRARKPELVITGFDRNQNGVLDDSEFVIDGDISAWDTNRDGVLTRDEYSAGLVAAGAMPPPNRSGFSTQDIVGAGEWLAFDVHEDQRVTPAGVDNSDIIVRVGVRAK